MSMLNESESVSGLAENTQLATNKRSAGRMISDVLPSGFVGRKASRVGLSFAAALSMCAGIGTSLAQAQAVNEQGWTVLEPSEDTRFIFVSASTGHDSNSGYSPSQAVRSFERAKELVRGGSADWMLLRRGDTWDEPIGTWNISGRSAEERLVITSYGDAAERPKIVVSSGNVITGGVNGDVGNVAIVGIHMEGDRPDEQTARGIRWLSTGENLLIEDCYIAGFKDNVTCESLNGEFRNFALRRSVIVDSWSTDGHSQGLFVIRTTGVLIEENIFDHNGWSETVAGADPSQFNQNIYVQKGVTDVEFIGNITSRASGAGVQLRSGGDAIDNVMYANPLGMRFGYRTIDWPVEQATGLIEGNVILGGEMATLENAGMGLWVERAADTQVLSNVIAHYVEGTISRAYLLNGHARDVSFVNNVSYNWVNDEGSGLAFKSSVRDGEGISFANNQWYMPGTDRLLSIVDTDGMAFTANDIFGLDSHDDIFHVDGSVVNYDEWNELSYVGEDQMGVASFPDPRGRDLDLYAQELGYSDSVEFLHAARRMSRTNWDADLTGKAAADWIRAGYLTGVNETEVSDAETNQ